jgi:hypothetical protein
MIKEVTFKRTSQKVAGSITDEDTGFFQFT